MNAWDFTLELISRVTPILLAFLTYMGIKAQRERAVIQVKLDEVAKSVDGMKTELVQATAKGSYLEGAKDATDIADIKAKDLKDNP